MTWCHSKFAHDMFQWWISTPT